MAIGLASFSHFLLILHLLVLRQGIQMAQRKVRQEVKTAAVTCLITWEILLYFLALVGTNGIVALFMFIAKILCLVLLARLIHSLDEAGYALKPKPAGIEPLTLVGLYGAVVFLGCALSFLFFSRYSMDWQERRDHAISTEASAIAEDLRSKGFPEVVLKDLTEEDIVSCRGTLSVMQQESVSNYPSSFSLRTIMVAAVLSETPRVWRVFYHFSLPNQKDYWGTETLEIRPYVFGVDGRDRITEAPRGWILREEESRTLMAPIPSVRKAFRQGERNLYTVWGEASSGALWAGESWYASFSLPITFQNARGYVSLTVKDPCPEIDYADRASAIRVLEELYNSEGVFYIHQINPWQYPVVSAADWRIQGGEDLGWIKGNFGEAFIYPYVRPKAWWDR